MKQEEIKIISYQPEHQPYFEQINRSWFEKHFHTQPEPIDKFVLTEPEKAIIERGGEILLLSYNDKIVGTVGIKKVNETTYEFTKMAVDEDYRGKGLGKILSEAAIEKAKTMGADKLVLYSHTSLQAALHIYRKLGFKEIPLEQGHYSHFRCDLKMELILDGIKIIQADISHAATIAAIGKRSFSDAFGKFFDEQEDLLQYLERTYKIEKIVASISNPNNVFFVAMSDNKMLGFAKIKKLSLNKQIQEDKQMELQKIYVLTEYHGSGTASALLGAILQLAEKLQPDCIWLDVIIENERAIRFYKKNGFEKCAKHYFKIGTQIFTYDVMILPIKKKLFNQSVSQMISYGNS